MGLLQRFCHSDVFWRLLIHLFHAHPQPLAGRQVSNEKQETPQKKKEINDRKDKALFYLIQFDNVWHVVLLFQLLLSFEQLVHAVVTAANLLIVLLLQHGSNAAEAAEAASPGAHPAAAVAAASRREWLGMNGASSYAECLSCPTYKFFCKRPNSPII